MERLEVRNDDVTLCFSCLAYDRRIQECIKNLMIDIHQPETQKRQQAFYGSCSDNVLFRKGSSFANRDSDWLAGDVISGWDAFFFENTDYPLHAKANTPGVVLLKLTIGKEQSQLVVAEDDIIFGSLNFKNQVGLTEIRLFYKKNGEDRHLVFTTEVLSYKMDYRTDMRSVIHDIEEEFALLSYDFLKETYLSFCESSGKTTDLIWWQIFRDCYDKILSSARYIIENPKRKLISIINYKRIEGLSFILPEMENEYGEFKHDPAHYYRDEELFLTNNNQENRFLKYVVLDILDRFQKVRKNIETIIPRGKSHILAEIYSMEKELNELADDPFFAHIGEFRGLKQDSLVLQNAPGYRDIYEYWIILQCGYDLQEGIMHLEVKDISDLYEIWCFIKIKNIVQHILGDTATIQTQGRRLSGTFIKNLLRGESSEIHFFDLSQPDVCRVSLSYNAQTHSGENQDESALADSTGLPDTVSKTTEQRPDIVLQLNKTNGAITYTYLFDAKYRIRDSTIPAKGGVDVPPVDAINQMHRYRDAIYYVNSQDDKLKREVIGGYILYPGNLSKTQFRGSYYQKSIDEVNIGAFPLKPGGHWNATYDKDGKLTKLLLDSSSAEDVLYNKIKAWILDTDPLQTLAQIAIPQKGLSYTKA